MKIWSLLSALLLAGIFLAAGQSLAGDNGAESIILNGGTMGSITFPHGRHQAVVVDCMACHELFPQESHVIDKLKSEGKIKKQTVMNMCKKCHKDMADKGQKSGPTLCKDCHKK